MEHRTYKIAGHAVQISSLYAFTHQMCEEYITKELPELYISTRQEDIDQERKKSEAEDRKEGNAVRCFPDEYLESLAIYRNLSEQLVDYDTLLFHGSVIAVDGMGYLFTAKSGTGKSTHTGLWKQMFGQRAVIVNDDKPLIYIHEKGIAVYGTPWDGKHHLSSNISVPLKGICILRRDAQNHIKRIDGKQAYPMVLQQAYRSVNPGKMMKILSMIDKLLNNVELYELGCNMDMEAARVAYEGMKYQNNLVNCETPKM